MRVSEAFSHMSGLAYMLRDADMKVPCPVCRSEQWLSQAHRIDLDHERTTYTCWSGCGVVAEVAPLSAPESRPWPATSRTARTGSCSEPTSWTCINQRVASVLRVWFGGRGLPLPAATRPPSRTSASATAKLGFGHPVFSVTGYAREAHRNRQDGICGQQDGRNIRRPRLFRPTPPCVGRGLVGSR